MSLPTDNVDILVRVSMFYGQAQNLRTLAIAARKGVMLTADEMEALADKLEGLAVEAAGVSDTAA